MKKLKKMVLHGLFLGAFLLIPVGATADVVQVQKVGVSYGEERPFSWYYPYEYSYYTPHREASSNQCYWIYTNGAYVYYCS